MKHLTKRILQKFNYSINRIPTPKNRFGININVGSGGYEINGFVSLDFNTKHYYPKSIKWGAKIIHYNMRSDDLPFENNKVDTIYCSHVIEHIETDFVAEFLAECHRVLKPEGVLRIACPDAFFLYEKTKNHPEYFSWHPLYINSQDYIKCFISLISTHKLKEKNYGLEKKLIHMIIVH